MTLPPDAVGKDAAFANEANPPPFVFPILLSDNVNWPRERSTDAPKLKML